MLVSIPANRYGMSLNPWLVAAAGPRVSSPFLLRYGVRATSDLTAFRSQSQIPSVHHYTRHPQRRNICARALIVRAASSSSSPSSSRSYVTGVRLVTEDILGGERCQCSNSIIRLAYFDHYSLHKLSINPWTC